MGSVTILELFLRGIPEAFLFIFSAYTFTRTSLNLKKYIISSIIYALIGFITRSLPVHTGVHIILNLFAFILLVSIINKIDLIKSIKTGIISVIIQSTCEFINIVIIQFIFKENISYVLGNPTMKILYGLPSIVLFGLSMFFYYVISQRKKTEKVEYGKDM